jgi:hypothetical protein
MTEHYNNKKMTEHCNSEKRLSIIATKNYIIEERLNPVAKIVAFTTTNDCGKILRISDKMVEFKMADDIVK